MDILRFIVRRKNSLNSNSEVIIELIDIYKSFGSREVLKGINLKIYKGDMISIMGKSGSGKSTLLNILGFFDIQTSGKYMYGGKEIKKNSLRSEIRNSNMGFVFQSYNLIPGLTVYENIVLPIYYSVHTKKVKNWINKVDELLEKYNLTEIRDSYVENISGGEKQRVCMARAIVCDANLIISDEPTGNLDIRNKQIVLDIFKELNSQGKTILIVTHDRDVEQIATKKFYLDGGELRPK